MTIKTTLSVLGMASIAAASFVYMDRLGLETGAFEDVRVANMVVPDTNGLVVGSRVLYRGVAVGEVTEVSSSVDRINVAWKYDSSYDIPVDSRFRVDNLSALGETYLAVLPETAAGPYLGDNAIIEDERVTVPTTFKELSEKLTRMLEQVDLNQIQNIFDEMDLALPEDARVLGNLNSAGELLASTITEQSDALTKLLATVQPILLDSSTVPADLRDAAPYLADFGGGLTNVIDGMHFAVDFGPLKDGIEFGAGPFIDNLQVFLDITAADLNILGVDLLPGVRSASAQLQTIDMARLLDNAIAATESGDALTVHVTTPGR
ncbi:MlaD family protein [Antrihabitans sp. YC2-6]|uniref:MlaD family protein n=1 Tax=Antrihabitans sp. YC2-6 TaxID=2799498 RepID=UPI0018F58630|nr:MlaD family protein [Antrihabitans sp. YC2-6]MBJ8345181.1 MCE family protein [Antrihabitans sp. YC2-6]